MTYHQDFEKSLQQIGHWVKEPIAGKAVVYAGTLENPKSEIRLLKYKTAVGE